ncbi:MAG TPA: hypothetical protein VNL38_02320 [Candidatus Nitrosotenuis sp.]|nr:hypothetical protein [Candidatus Nitrosotenuis sp.]
MFTVTVIGPWLFGLLGLSSLLIWKQRKKATETVRVRPLARARRERT